MGPPEPILKTKNSLDDSDLQPGLYNYITLYRSRYVFLNEGWKRIHLKAVVPGSFIMTYNIFCSPLLSQFSKSLVLNSVIFSMLKIIDQVLTFTKNWYLILYERTTK